MFVLSSLWWTARLTAVLLCYPSDARECRPLRWVTHVTNGAGQLRRPLDPDDGGDDGPLAHPQHPALRLGLALARAAGIPGGSGRPVRGGLFHRLGAAGARRGAAGAAGSPGTRGAAGGDRRGPDRRRRLPDDDPQELLPQSLPLAAALL